MIVNGLSKFSTHICRFPIQPICHWIRKYLVSNCSCFSFVVICLCMFSSLQTNICRSEFLFSRVDACSGPIPFQIFFLFFFLCLLLGCLVFRSTADCRFDLKRMEKTNIVQLTQCNIDINGLLFMVYSFLFLIFYHF